MDAISPPAVVQQAEETEQQIVEKAIAAVAKIDDCKWEVGRLAHEWTERFAKDRTDEDFGKLVGLSRSQVQQRRQVFATYGDVCNTYCKLSWSHFNVSLDWSDAEYWLGQANDLGLSVAEMQRMRNAQLRLDRGEDLTQPAEPEDTDTEQPDTESEHVAGVDPVQREPSIVKPTPKAESQPESPPEKVAKPETKATSTKKATTSVVKTTLTTILDRLESLLSAITPELKSKTEKQQLAEKLRHRADQLDPPEESTTATPAAVVAAEWNMIANVPRCKTVTKNRQKAVRTRMKDRFFRDNWRDAMQRVANSSFCTGGGDTGWRADLDWFLKPDSVVKLMEGKFDDTSGEKSKDVWRVPPSEHVPEVEDRTGGNYTPGDSSGDDTVPF